MPLLILLCVLVGGTEPAVGLPREDLPWVRVETPHFTVFSYAPEAKTLQIVNEVERFRALLEFVMPREAPKRAAKIPIFVFASNSGFAPYNRPGLTGDVERFGGFFRNTRFGPYIGLSVDSRTVYRATVYHEAVHGFLRDGAILPLWLEEGIAEYLSGVALLEDGARVGLELDQHLNEIRGKPWTPLRWTLGLNGQSASYNDADRAGPFYSYSWLVVHYLLEEGREGPMTVQQLLDAVRLGGSPDGSGLLRGLDGPLRDYSKRRTLPSSVVAMDVNVAAEDLEFVEVDRATMLLRLGELQAYANGRLPEAEEHFREALRLAPTSTDAMTGLCYVMERTGRADEAASVWSAVVKAGSPGFRKSLIRAWGILESVQPMFAASGPDESFAPSVREARQLLEQAVKLDPDSGAAQYGLGLTYSYDVVDVGPGIVALERARELLKGAPDVEASLAILYARAGRTDDSTALLGALRARGVDSKMTAAIQRTIVDAQNETTRILAEKGEFHTAIVILTGILAQTTDALSRSALERKIEWLGAQARQRAIYHAYNRAVALANQRKLAEAYEILDELVQQVQDPRLEPAIEDLHRRIGEMLGRDAATDD